MGTHPTKMLTTTALYLAHLNPLTKAHLEIIADLCTMAQKVKIMPVIFKNKDKEINSRSFPFTYEQRRDMITAEFGDSNNNNNIQVTSDYTFYAPFKRYMPPLLAPKSWKLRAQILKDVQGNYFTYTGDRAEAYMLKLYRLHPKIGTRKSLSATSVKQKLYQAAVGLNDHGTGSSSSDTTTNWENDVSAKTTQIIKKHWDVIKKFSSIEDKTTRILGMKFPKEGY